MKNLPWVFVRRFSSSTQKVVECSTISPRIAAVTLNDPNRRNALSLQMLRDIKSVLGEISQKPEVGVVILRAQGNVFSAGHDLKEIERNRDNQDFHKELFGLVHFFNILFLSDIFKLH